MSPPEEKRVRARKPKTRTGCKTCKFRRVKCDERKPYCLRCITFGVECEGYDDIKSNPPREASMRELIPRTSGNHPLAPTRMKHSIATFFEDSREFMYFLNYQEEASLELSGPFDTSLWNRVVLRACHSEPSLCRLTSAVGALNRAWRLRALGHYEEEAMSHEKYAYREYGRALKGMQDLISNRERQDSTRIALIAALLIFCFENLHGDYDLAIVHMESALRLMHKQLQQVVGRPYNHLKNESPTSSLDDELVTAFVRMDSQLLSRPDNSKTRYVGSEVVRLSILDINYSAEIFKVPERFKNIAEARSYLEHMQFGVLPSLAHEFGVQINEDPDTINNFALNFCKTHTEQFYQWRSAFAPLYAEACKSRKGKDFAAVATLRISGLSTQIVAQRMSIRGHNVSGLYENESHEMIELARLVIADPSFRRGFVYDCGIVPGLFIVVVICENWEIRTEALQLLRSAMPRREGAWDSVPLFKVAERIMHMAEAGSI